MRTLEAQFRNQLPTAFAVSHDPIKRNFVNFFVFHFLPAWNIWEIILLYPIRFILEFFDGIFFLNFLFKTIGWRFLVLLCSFFFLLTLFWFGLCLLFLHRTTDYWILFSFSTILISSFARFLYFYCQFCLVLFFSRNLLFWLAIDWHIKYFWV